MSQSFNIKRFEINCALKKQFQSKTKYKEDVLIMAQTKDIRNVCLISHSSSGKTSLAEAMLYNNKLIDRFGKVEDGTTVSDYDSEEIIKLYHFAF